jgi:hypothetical protein
VFGGLYYIVFSTVDKQSGVDHYEVFENGAWEKVVSPYKLPDQSLKSEIKVKAIDKAGNERVGDYAGDVIPPSQAPVNPYDSLLWALSACIAFVLGIGGYYALRNRYRRAHHAHEQDPM